MTSVCLDLGPIATSWRDPRLQSGVYQVAHALLSALLDDDRLDVSCTALGSVAAHRSLAQWRHQNV